MKPSKGRGKYIFDLYWFNHGGCKRNGITPDQYQTEPTGGWQNWTAAHNVNYMQDMIAEERDFTLMGVLSTLYGQANNAGNGETRCMVGVEVLLLLSAGYTFSARSSTDGGEVVCHFTHPGGPVIANAQLVNDAVLYLDSKGGAATFWTTERKKTYKALLEAVNELS